MQLIVFFIFAFTVGLYVGPLYRHLYNYRPIIILCGYAHGRVSVYVCICIRMCACARMRCVWIGACVSICAGVRARVLAGALACECGRVCWYEFCVDSSGFGSQHPALSNETTRKQEFTDTSQILRLQPAWWHCGYIEFHGFTYYNKKQLLQVGFFYSIYPCTGNKRTLMGDS